MNKINFTLSLTVLHTGGFHKSLIWVGILFDFIYYTGSQVDY